MRHLNMIDVYNQFRNNFPSINIGDRVGATGYIDFLKRNEVPNNVMFGKDRYGRNFMTIKFEVEFDNGEIENYFQTFFQRYNDDDKLWHGAGSYEQLMETCGGMNQRQIGLVSDLLEHGTVNLTDNESILDEYRFRFRDYGNLTPIKITLD